MSIQSCTGKVAMPSRFLHLNRFINTLAHCNADEYLKAAIKKSLPDENDGLHDDEWCKELENKFPMYQKQYYYDGWHAYRKSFIGGADSYENRGIALRYFWDEEKKRLMGAVRFVGPSLHSWKHRPIGFGGAVAAVLDEATAEVVRATVSPDVVTAHLSYKLRKPVLGSVTHYIEATLLDTGRAASEALCRLEGAIGTTSPRSAPPRLPVSLAMCTVIDPMRDQIVGTGHAWLADMCAKK